MTLTAVGAEIEAEYELLTNPATELLLAAVTAAPDPRPADISRWRKDFSPQLVTAAIRLVQARRKAAAKFIRAGEMWLDPVGSEQATAETVARHKASRFPADAFVVDLCSGIGGDALALGEKVRGVLSVDFDQSMARRLRWNAGVYGLAEDRILPVRARAEGFAVPSRAFVHIDPDRRARAGLPRAKDLEGYVPGPEFLAGLARKTIGGAIKLGPASDFETLARQINDVETEVISLDGECKEVTLWFGALGGGCRRATVLPAGDFWVGPIFHETSPSATVGVPIGQWLFEPDAALLRSGLLDHFASAHGLDRLDPPLDWLTAEKALDSPFLTAFRVEAILPLDRKRVRKALSSSHFQVAEIKTRALGPEWRPELLRKQLVAKAGGPPVSLILLGGTWAGRAVLATRRGSEVR